MRTDLITTFVFVESSPSSPVFPLPPLPPYPLPVPALVQVLDPVLPPVGRSKTRVTQLLLLPFWSEGRWREILDQFQEDDLVREDDWQ